MAATECAHEKSRARARPRPISSCRKASSVTARGRVVIQKALSADHDVTLAETSRRGHATRLAQGAAASGGGGTGLSASGVGTLAVR